MGGLRDKFQRFMMGRYGIDELSRFLNIVTLVILVVSMIIQRFFPLAGFVLWGLTLGLIVYTYFRIFSKNISARTKENQWYCSIRYRKTGGRNPRGNAYGYGGQSYYGNQGGYQQPLTNEQKKALDRKTHKIFKCPNCAQKIRVPKNRGKICIKCPNCRIEFIKKT